MKKFIIVILAIIALLPLHGVSADWAGSFVVYSGDIYEISDDELIPSEEIDKKIGHVTKYSDEEGTYRGNFSNIYPKGTPYYSIINTDPKDYIAIKTQEGIFVKAYNKGHYPNDELVKKTIWMYLLLGTSVIVLLIIWIMKRKKAVL
ncbi:hypothetical protein [Paenibacillus sp. B2(2019)]|uniref:hypothetical protein n=1 Tax=Paenibacillus sp. B2(2019) TaxID=2607754 RepID=UPI00165F3953|nr:hypothetical protein [Paenibacillus sp. B2(2019)]